MKSVVFVSFMLAAVSGAWASTCSVKHDTAMSLDYYKNVKVSQSGCCDLCASDSRCRTAVYSPRGECHLHDAKDSARAFKKRGWMLMAVTPAPPTPTTKNIVQLAQATPDLSTLVAALVAGGLTGTLSGKGPFTVFAPTNEAFAKIETKALNALLQNKAQLDKVLEYHVLAANLRMRELMTVKIVKTLEGESLDVSNPGGVIKVNNAKVLTADVAASNGFVHIIDSVLMVPSGPPLPLKKDIVHVAEGNADLSTLVAALTAGKLVATLEGKGPFTVFAPTNEAFAKIPKDTLTKLLGNQKLLDQVLEYHVLSGDFSMRDLMAAKLITTLEKEEVLVRSMNNAIMVNNADVVVADVEATNGVVHVVDKVLVPPDFPLALYPEDIVELSESQPSLSTLVQALVAGKLTATLSGKGPYTVFAPTNDAFGKIPAAALQKLLANPTELDKVLEYHVLAGKFSMRDLMAVLSVKTLEGENVKVSGSGKVINVNEAKVLKADVEASNGVVHVIDTVLSLPKDVMVSAPPTPTTKNIVQLAQATPDLSTLVTALVAGGLTGTLSGKGPFTVFAPTNEAFAKIETKALNALLKNKAQLDKLLEYHVLAANLRMRELMTVKTVKTLEGETLDVTDPGGVIKVNNAKVLTADVAASNGFVHIIDTVLMTPSGPPLPLKKDIVHVAEGNADLSTLVAALTAGKLVATLEGTGPFTVFAPTNKAFAKIPKHTLTKLLGNQKLLDQLLEYHVLSGEFSKRGLIEAGIGFTLEKEIVIVRSMNNAIMVNNANVVVADVEATNGVVHVVDKVLVSPNFPLALYPEDIVELSESQPSLSTLVQALVAGKLTATLSGKGPYTVFAPTNDAFAKIPAADLQKLLANPTELDKLLEYHVLAGKFSMRDLMSVLSAKTLEGQNLKVSGSGKVINVNDAKVLKADVEASNGVVHVIDTVLMPPNAPSPAWKPCSSTSKTCCNPFTSPQQICQNWKKSGGAKCQACGGGNACECPQADVMV